MGHRDHLRDDELLHFVDGELAAHERHAVDAHLRTCDACGARRDRFAALASRMSRTPGDLEPLEPRFTTARTRLQLRLAHESNRASAGWLLPMASPARWAAAACVLGMVAVALARLGQGGPDEPVDPVQHHASGVAVERDALPVASLTPGATLDLEAGALCAQAPKVQEIAAAVRLSVLRSYGMEQVPADQYELDYLITPALGGAPEARNLWPQRYAERVWNAGVKDQLEDLLPRLVCEGRVDLRTAQRDIAADWVAAYRKYFKTGAPLKPSTAMVSLAAFTFLTGQNATFH
jgi:anti-sigma factor RsiW